ncbi:hypothetical protein Poli38472_007171 [Pythium oligandrum]|uniref:Uncharacterized protein n=1 Tax=Pythium oligandrum TaxID=41045 RepID=A0A8K1FE43_PYTOL|nr:hypothetical protein Poli38472_007171 [Pythium oligandrum]|eukprot:TMW59026.1 hypothetical protein Poli38472_007171 [Pythium oligandrum]
MKEATPAAMTDVAVMDGESSASTERTTSAAPLAVVADAVDAVDARVDGVAESTSPKMPIHHILNDASDEIVGESEPMEQASTALTVMDVAGVHTSAPPSTVVSTTVKNTQVSTVVPVVTGQDPATAQLLLSLASPSLHRAEPQAQPQVVAEEPTQDDVEMEIAPESQSSTQPQEPDEEGKATEPTSSTIPPVSQEAKRTATAKAPVSEFMETATASTEDVAMESTDADASSGRSRRPRRASARAKAAGLNLVRPGEEPIAGAPSGSTARAREKRPPPRFTVESTPPKRSRKAASAPVPSSAESVTHTEDEDVEFVIASENVQKPVVETKKSKSRKRPGISQRQMAELIERQTDPIPDMPANSHRVDQGRTIRNCMFCKAAHSTHTLFHCAECARVYHDRCLANKYRPMVDKDQPFEDQLEKLTLHHDESRTSLLRCGSCLAGFMDIFRGDAFQWDCDCPTCTTAPEKIVAYRRHMIKLIIEQHNEQLDAKKKKGKAPVKAKTGGAGTTKSNPKTTGATPARKGSKRTRGAAAMDDSDVLSTRTRGSSRGVSDENGEETGSVSGDDEHGVVDADSKENNLDDQANAGGMDVDNEQSDVKGTEKMPASQPSTTPIGVTDEHEDSKLSSNGHNLNSRAVDSGEYEEPLTLNTILEHVDIQAVDDECVRIPIACSATASMQQGGKFKLGTLVWNKRKSSKVSCSCCSNTGKTQKWFVEHTDPSLVKGEKVEFLHYLFAVRRDLGRLYPLQDVVSLVRGQFDALPRSQGTARTKKLRTASDADDEETKKEQERNRHLDRLRRVRWGKGQKTSPSTRGGVQPKYTVELVCSDPRYMHKLDNGDVRDKASDSDIGTESGYKTGTLEVCVFPFKRGSVTCKCCDASMQLVDWVNHTTTSGKIDDKMAKHYLYVRLHESNLTVITFLKFCMSLDFVSGIDDQVTLNKTLDRIVKNL